VYASLGAGTCIGLAAQSVPRSKASAPAGFWPLPEDVLELVCRLHLFLIRVGGQVSNRHLHVVRNWSDAERYSGPELLNMKYSLHEANPWTALAFISGFRSSSIRANYGGNLMGRFKSKVGPSSIPPSPSHPRIGHHFPAVTRAPGQSTVRNSVLFLCGKTRDKLWKNLYYCILG